MQWRFAVCSPLIICIHLTGWLAGWMVAFQQPTTTEHFRLQGSRVYYLFNGGHNFLAITSVAL